MEKHLCPENRAKIVDALHCKFSLNIGKLLVGMFPDPQAADVHDLVLEAIAGALHDNFPKEALTLMALDIIEEHSVMAMALRIVDRERNSK